ncbi:hypothetical protein GCM10008967_31410 [Bacillus carboniphilus]|uniref:Uncharacterized protein n=1 Tax=Bacillus carboniphilus TaxID=86663 RepID=A0ABN0WIV6_9BACI
MDLDTIYSNFVNFISQNEEIHLVELKKVVGVPFIYIHGPIELTTAEKKIKEASSKSMRGKRLSSQTVYVRSDESLHVFRHRFYVPQRKMFCCGNLCVDCVRLSR